ncbi:MAG: hypothetical protein ABSE93_27465 [Terriglobia bacterium]
MATGLRAVAACRQRDEGIPAPRVSPVYADKKSFKAASPAGQAAFVKNALGWVKAYSESAEFKADYDSQRVSAKPAPPQSKGTPDEQFAKFLAEQRDSLATMKKNVAQMSPDLQKQMESTVKQMEASVERSSKDPQDSGDDEAEFRAGQYFRAKGLSRSISQV